jgi:hypothetical protein
MSETSSKKRKLSLPLVLAGGVSSLVLALGMSPTFSAFTAQITNDTNNTSAGTLVMEESTVPATVTCKSTDGGNVTSNAATCSTINKYGGTNLAPGGIATTTVVIKNSGNLTPASFSLTPLGCTQTGTVAGSALDICAQMTLVLKQDGIQKYTGPLSTFGPAAISLTPVAPTLTSTFTFQITFGVSTLGNTYQGLTANQSLIWKFQS